MGKGTGMVLGTKTCIRILTWGTLTHRVYPYPWPSLYDCQKCQSVGDECRAKWSAGVSEHDGAWSVMEKNAEQWWTWPQLVCCALALKNLVSINFRLRKYYGELRSSVDQNMEQCGSKHGAMGSKHGATGSKCRAKDMCFISIPNWSLSLRQAHLNTEIMEI